MSIMVIHLIMPFLVLMALRLPSIFMRYRYKLDRLSMDHQI